MKDSELPRGTETYNEYSTRVISGLEYILQNCDGHPLVVAHGGVFVAIASALGFPRLRASNCSIFEFSPPAGSHPWKVVELTASGFESF